MTDDPIERVKASDGDLVLDFIGRVGARPYARYVDGEWDLMSLTHVPTPEYGEPEPEGDHPVPHNTKVHTVDVEPDPENHDEDDLREMATHPFTPTEDAPEWAGVTVIDYEDSPFADREDIPTYDDIVREVLCPECGESFRQYVPDPFDACPYCDADAPEVA